LGSAPVIVEASHWRAEHVALIGDYPDQTIPPIDPATVRPLIDGIDQWDLWPLQLADGATASFDGWSLWFVLSAPALPDPDLRHGVARIRLMLERGGAWRDCGDALPDGLNPGSREWAGSALYDPDSGKVTLFYTVAGHRGETGTTFAQRLFQTSGTLLSANGDARILNWSEPSESVASDDDTYVLVNQAQGRPGFIKGFRDPAHFRDPASGETYLLFTASLKRSASDWNGAIGIARATDAGLSSWRLLPPLLSADTLNNEQERPHVIFHGGLYYLFWSTQRHVFAPDGPSGPNGLYGMAAPSLFGPYEPLNGTGLIAANPPEAPFQAYSWWVTSDLEVAGFADLPGVAAKSANEDAAWRRAHFSGVPAPRFRIELDGSKARVAKG
jgi:levansucrase